MVESDSASVAVHKKEVDLRGVGVQPEDLEGRLAGGQRRVHQGSQEDPLHHSGEGAVHPAAGHGGQAEVAGAPGVACRTYMASVGVLLYPNQYWGH